MDRPATLRALTGTVGLWTLAHEWVDPRDAGELALEVEALGYSALWIDESWGREALTSAAVLLAPTSSLVVATGIANIWARDAVATANAARTLSAWSAQRFVLGLGVSHRPLVERLRGHSYDRPVATMRDYLSAMDAAPMVAAESAESCPRVLAALGPTMLALGASATDGVLPYLVTPEYTAVARGVVGASFLAVEQAAVLGGDRAEYLRRAHAHLEHYTGLENYRASWRRQGFTDDDYVRGGSERLCDAMVVHGDEVAVAQRVDEHRRAGADHVCLQVLGADVRDAPRDEWRRLAPALTT
ncbi:MAG: TIGR03620 family F420-dependent LLM class oxidoreductase [Acidimicrobiales bacterium]